MVHKIHYDNIRSITKFSTCNRSFTDKKEAIKCVYSNICDSMMNLIHAVDELNIKLGNDEDEKKMEEAKSTVFKYFEMAQAMQVKNQEPPKRNCLSASDDHTVPEGLLISPSDRRKLTSSTSDIDEPDYICPTAEVVTALKYLWSSPSIQKAYERRHEFQLLDSAAYFLQDLDRVCVHNYEPTDEDVLRTRAQTIGIVKIEFAFRHLTVSHDKKSPINFSILY